MQINIFNSKKLQTFIDALAFFLSVLFVFLIVREIDIPQIQVSLSLVFFVLSLFGLHIFKFIRCFFLVFDTSIRFGVFLEVYFRTVITNILFPFKTGELYRFYALSIKCDNALLVFLAIITERFYDIVILVFFLLTLYMFFNIALPAIFWLFLFVVLSCFVFYQIFPGIHIFLNQYLVRKRNNKYDIAALRFLDRLHFLYITQKVIIGEKGKLLLIISLVIWIINGFLIYLLMKLFNIPFELETIRDTISRMVLFGSRTNFDKNNDIITVIFSVFALIICKTVRRKQGE